MEKDLRDAYAALKLLRADLVQTRRDKRALEATVKFLEAHGPPPSAAQTRESRETQRMTDEDVWGQMRRLQERYEAALRAVNDKEEEEPEQDNQEEVEKLTLLAKLHGLKEVVEQQRQELERRDGEFQVQRRRIEELEKEEKVLQVVEQRKKELENEVERVRSTVRRGEKELKEARAISKSLQKEMQKRTDKYEEERLQLERKLAAHAQTSSILKQQLAEKEEESDRWASEREKRELGVKLEHEQNLDAMAEDLTSSLRQERERAVAQLRDGHQSEMFVLQQKYAVLELQLSSEREKALQQKEEAQERYATTLRDLQNSCAELQTQLAESESKMSKQAQGHENMIADANERIAQHEKKIRALAMEKKALQQEVREAQHITKLTKEELIECHAKVEQKRQDGLRILFRAQLQCQMLETQLMSSEDHRNLSCDAEPACDDFALEAFHGLSDNELAALPLTELWSVLRTGINEIGNFLPSLLTLLHGINDALSLCGHHADALPVLCEQLQGKIGDKEALLIVPTALSLLRFSAMLRFQSMQEESPVTLKLVRSFHKHVLNALAQWYECDASGTDSDHGDVLSVPTPTFAISSRETALILQNWTHDRKKQLAVKRWLARMEVYPDVPPLRGAVANDNKVPELPPEGCMLELDDMTPEVKDAFRLLLIPILKQNRALHVRVFTRYMSTYKGAHKQQRQRDFESPEHDEDKVWAMRIHVQSAAARRPRTNSATRPPPLNLEPSPRGSPSPLAPTSPASSVSSSTSSTASTRLQIIQERLQFLHTTGI